MLSQSHKTINSSGSCNMKVISVAVDDEIHRLARIKAAQNADVHVRNAQGLLATDALG